MTCPRCGASNREGASYCDSCGNLLTASVYFTDGLDLNDGESKDTGSRLLVGLMTVDWLWSFAVVGVGGIIGAVIAVFSGLYDYMVLFLLMGIMGLVVTRYILRHNPMHD